MILYIYIDYSMIINYGRKHMVKDKVTKAISLRIDQNEWLKVQRQQFNFSKFCQDKLDDYIKMTNDTVIEVTG